MMAAITAIDIEITAGIEHICTRSAYKETTTMDTDDDTVLYRRRSPS